MGYSETTSQSFLSRIFNSIGGVLVGIVLIVVASVILFNNEGRINLAKLAETSTEITQMDTANNGKLVNYKGKLTAENMKYTYLKDNNFVELKSLVEVYAWVEKSTSKTRNKIGGGKETTTEYSYSMQWTVNPVNPKNFKDDDYKKKPEVNVDIKIENYKNQNLKVGDFVLDPSVTVDGLERLVLKDELLKEEVLKNANQYIDNNYLYFKATTKTDGDNQVNPTADNKADDNKADENKADENKTDENQTEKTAPKLGDVRVSYMAVKSDVSGTIMGKQDGNKIVNFKSVDKKTKDAEIYRFFTNLDNKDAVVSQLNSEHNTKMWIIRIIGTVLVILGFFLIGNPLTEVLMVLPFLGNGSKFILGFIALVVGFVYSALLIIISAIVHNVIALVIVLAIIAFLVFMGLKKAKAKKLATKKKR